MRKKGLFMKLIVVFCILYVVRITEVSLDICRQSLSAPSAIYGTAVGFFGAELVMLVLKKILGDKNNNGLKM